MWVCFWPLFCFVDLNISLWQSHMLQFILQSCVSPNFALFFFKIEHLSTLAFPYKF
jgi:hypothetical protein